MTGLEVAQSTTSGQQVGWRWGRRNVHNKCSKIVIQHVSKGWGYVLSYCFSSFEHQLDKLAPIPDYSWQIGFRNEPASLTMEPAAIARSWDFLKRKSLEWFSLTGANIRWKRVSSGWKMLVADPHPKSFDWCLLGPMPLLKYFEIHGSFRFTRILVRVCLSRSNFPLRKLNSQEILKVMCNNQVISPTIQLPSRRGEGFASQT